MHKLGEKNFRWDRVVGKTTQKSTHYSVRHAKNESMETEPTLF